jgi:hypothetical protein
MRYEKERKSKLLDDFFGILRIIRRVLSRDMEKVNYLEEKAKGVQFLMQDGKKLL